MPTTEFRSITYDVSGHVATITLSRPEQLNAGNAVMVIELLQAFDLSDADDDVRAIIVTGAGRAFCAGADLSAGADTFAFRRRDGTSADPSTFRDGAGLISLRIFDSLKPVIGAINGAAVGMGATIILPMDSRLASETARIGYVFARRGMVPEGASGWFLPRVVGIGKAMEWVSTGRLVEPDEAMAAGLVSSVHAPDDLLPAAHELAAEIVAQTSPVSVTMARHMMWRGLTLSHPMEAHKVDSYATLSRGATPDAAEGVTSFLEKRPPEFPLSSPRDLPAFFPWWHPEEFPTGTPGEPTG